MPKERAKTLRTDIYDHNPDFVSSDMDAHYWNECERAHGHKEITDELEEFLDNLPDTLESEKIVAH